MQSWNFHPGPQLIIGAGSAQRVPELLKGRSRCLLVTDKLISGLGLIDPLLDALRDAGIDLCVFDEVEADPSRETVEKAVRAGRSADADFVIGFGGGSPMDVAKLCAYLLGSNDDLDAIWGANNAKGQRLPLILIPTTAGTGSESTQVSVITCEGGEKKGVRSTPLFADYAILDATLTLGLPRHVTAHTGIDAMVHAIEAYTSGAAKNPISDMLAREALALLSANLLVACDQPTNLAARQAMLLGANLAGLSFANAMVGGVHALAYPLGGIHHLPHGLSNALMMRPVMNYNRADAQALYAELAPIVTGASEAQSVDERCTALIEHMTMLVAASGIAPRLRDNGIEQSHLAELAAEAMKQDRLLSFNPRPIDEAAALSLYEAAY